MRGIAGLPSVHDLGEHLAVRLRSELAQRVLGMLHRFALGTKGGPAQPRPAIVETASVQAPLTAMQRLGAIALSRGAHGATIALTIAPRSAVRAIGTSAVRRLGLTGSGPIITAHSHHRFRRGCRSGCQCWLCRCLGVTLSR